MEKLRNYFFGVEHLNRNDKNDKKGIEYQKIVKLISASFC